MSKYVKIFDWIQIKISGPDTNKYLNGLITKDLEKMEDGEITRSAFLTANGHIRSVYWVEKMNENSLTFYCPGEMKDALVEDLLKYKLDKMDVKLEDVTEETDPLYLVQTDEELIPGLSIESTGFIPKNLPDEPQGEELDYEQFTQWLVDHGITPPKVMIDQNPYEVGIEDTISLEKGCFLGQEPISRMYHRGNPRKFVYQFSTDDEIPESAEIKQDDNSVGEVLITTSKKGLGFIRRTVDMEKSNLVVNGKKLKNIQRVGNYPPQDR